MGFLAKLFALGGRPDLRLAAVRMSKHGHHYYSILASNSGFEFVFQNGKDRWSTISAPLAKRTIDANREGNIGNQVATNRMQFLELAIGDAGSSVSSWEVSEVIYYKTRDEAIELERKILDISWANAEDKLDDN